ncbi:WhiB family transcriptional regulator [Streptomyces sp. NPDC090026]|uniref:WhiB family transcriptional regulator n=1 Tax=Streptomyces sp. NPDC090026 TaxID=3365923 RepID=UPI00381C971D
MAADLTGALCALPGEKPSDWFREREDTVGGKAATAHAVRTCLMCPVKTACLEQQMAVEGRTAAASRFGVFGGLTGKQRWRLYDTVRRLAPTVTAA